jgi:regulator of nucleoside diphosphate kinase
MTTKTAAKTIILTANDQVRLSRVLDLNHSFGSAKMGECIRGLNADLVNAKIVDSAEVPADIVTMNSRVVLEDLDTAEQEEWSLCYPKQADIYENRVSILAPMGIAMLGAKVGDHLEWEAPSGAAHARLVKVTYQPELAGDMDL